MAKRKISTELHIDKSKESVIGEIKRLSNLELTIAVFENGQELNVDGQEIYAECYRADGSLAKQDCDIVGIGNTIICNLKNGVFSYPGIAEIDLTLIDIEGQMTTASLYIKVTGRAVEVDGSAPENFLPDLSESINTFEAEMKKIIVNTEIKGDTAINKFITAGDAQILFQQEDYDNLRRIIINENQAAELQDQINKTKQQSVENANKIKVLEDLTPVWQEHTGTGTVTINDSFEGTVKDLVIKGKTIGGWNAETEQFDSIASTGESEGNKINILSVGKNLLNLNTRFTGGDRAYFNIILDKNKDYVISSKIALTYKIAICSATEIVNNHPKELRVLGTGMTVKFNSNDFIGNYILLFHQTNMALEFPTYFLQLEQNTVASKYEEYKEHKVEVQLPFEGGLRGLTKYKDVADFEKGIITRVIETLVINGSENWVRESLATTNCIQFYTLGWSNERINDTLKTITNEELIADNEGIRVDGDISLSILKSRLETPDVNGLKKWLQANPITLYQATQNPRLHNIEKMSLLTYDGTTHIMQENNLAGDMSFKAKISLSAQNNRIKKNNEELKIENENLKKDLKAKSEYFHSNDLSLTHSDLELDFRMMELEFALDIPINIKKGRVKNMAARTPYEMMKVLIIGGVYEREDLEYKISVYQKRGRMTQSEAEELKALMDAREVMTGK